MENQQEKKRPTASYAKYSGLAFQMGGAMLLLAYLGYQIDLYLGTKPLFLVILLLLAVAINMMMVVKSVSKK